MELEMNKTYVQKLLTLTFGNIIAALGVALCVLAGKGADPLTVLYQGVCNVTGLQIGAASLVVNIVMLIICIIMDRKSIKSGTIISMFTFSMFLNCFINSMGEFIADSGAVLMWIYLLLGIVLMGIGFSTSIMAGIGPNCLDVILGILMTRTKFSMKICKSIIDFSSTVIGVCLGASFGIGTVLCVLFVGVIYTLNMRLLKLN